MGYFPEAIQRSELKHGDHVFYYRATVPVLNLGFYTHHGIYDKEEERVIHFDWRDHSFSKTGSDYAPEFGQCPNCEISEFGVRKSCVDCFLLGEPDRHLYRCKYGQRKWDLLLKDAGTCSTQLGDEAPIVVQRARDAHADHCFHGKGTLRGRWRPWNNCETFAYFCKTGKKSVGKQMKRLVVTASAGGLYHLVAA